MNLLAFDTSTERLSVALAHAGGVLRHEGPGGAQASTTLIPAVRALLGEAGLRLQDLAAIAFGRGPGSFTGLRTACAVAQGLAFGAGLPLLPVETLLAVAEDARERTGTTQLVCALDARMNEVYAAAYAWEDGAWTEHAAAALHAPEAIVLPAGWALAGNAAAVYAGRLPPAPSIEAWPTAAAMLRLAPALLARGEAVAAADALPLYVRDKVAQTTAERMAARQAVAP